MKPIISIFIFAILFFTACKKTIISQSDLIGTLTGKVVTLDEFKQLNGDNEDIIIYLDGSDPELKTTTGFDGNFLIDNIPSGTYNLVISKEGYGDWQNHGFPIVGGNVPYNLTTKVLMENSSTTIDDLNLERLSENRYLIKGTVYHNYDTDANYNNKPSIRWFYNSQDDVSYKNYLGSHHFEFSGESGSEFEIVTSLNYTPNPGSKIYLIAYGCSRSGGIGNRYYDIVLNREIYTGLGTGSNITNITVPQTGQ